MNDRDVDADHRRVPVRGHSSNRVCARNTEVPTQRRSRTAGPCQHISYHGIRAIRVEACGCLEHGHTRRRRSDPALGVTRLVVLGSGRSRSTKR